MRLLAVMLDETLSYGDDELKSTYWIIFVIFLIFLARNNRAVVAKKIIKRKKMTGDKTEMIEELNEEVINSVEEQTIQIPEEDIEDENKEVQKEIED